MIKRNIFPVFVVTFFSNYSLVTFAGCPTSTTDPRVGTFHTNYDSCFEKNEVAGGVFFTHDYAAEYLLSRVDDIESSCENFPAAGYRASLNAVLSDLDALTAFDGDLTAASSKEASAWSSYVAACNAWDEQEYEEYGLKIDAAVLESGFCIDYADDAQFTLNQIESDLINIETGIDNDEAYHCEEFQHFVEE